KRRRGGTLRATPPRAPDATPAASPAQSTVRFRRGEEGDPSLPPAPDQRQAIAVGDQDATQRIATPPSWGMEAVPDERADSAPARDRSVLWYAGATLAMVSLVVAAFFARERFAPRGGPPKSATFSDAGTVEVPVVTPRDSLA